MDTNPAPSNPLTPSLADLLAQAAPDSPQRNTLQSLLEHMERLEALDHNRARRRLIGLADQLDEISHDASDDLDAPVAARWYQQLAQALRNSAFGWGWERRATAKAEWPRD